MPRTILESYCLDPVFKFPTGDFFIGEDIRPFFEVSSNRLIGIEVEVENNPQANLPESGVWFRESDGSLRNNGVEYISHPIEARKAPFALCELFETCLPKDECCFGPRTSIHVHVNAQDLIESQVIDIVLLYSIIEPLFYKFAGRNRVKNIYCVPLSDTNLITSLVAKGLAEVLLWPKYSGLNLQPLASKGTLEFRHMHGTFDYQKVSIWIQLITKLFDYVLTQENSDAFRLRLLNQNPDTYPTLLCEVFGEDVMYLKYQNWNEVHTVVENVHQAFVSPSLIRAMQGLVSRNTPYFMGAQ